MYVTYVCHVCMHACAAAAPSYTSNLLWALHDVWRQFAYGDDLSSLRSLWPVLVGHMNLHLHMLSPGADGKLHLPPSWSPEYNEKVTHMGAGDTTYHLSLVRWGLERLIEGCHVLSCTDPGHETWEATLSKLADFATDPHTGGLRVAANLSFSVSHRHFSHLFPCFPLGLLNATDPRCTIATDQWYAAAMHGPWAAPDSAGDWCLWSMAVLSSISTLMGRPEASWSNLTATVHDNVFPQMTPFGSSLMPNTMYGEGCSATAVGGAPCGDPTGEVWHAMPPCHVDPSHVLLSCHTGLYLFMILQYYILYKYIFSSIIIYHYIYYIIII